MGRLTHIAFAASLAALGFGGLALADETPARPAAPMIAAGPVAGQAHLVFRSDDRETALEGRVTVVERRSGVVVVEELSQACDEACQRRKLAWAEPPQPPVRE